MYGFTHQVHDIALAVSLLGLRETYSIVLSVSVADFVKKLKNVDYRSFWLDSMCCAAAARIVAKASGRRNLAGIFTAGLLHDIGRAVLWEVVPLASTEIDSELEGAALVAAEQEAIGLTHGEAGYELASHWGLPAELAEPVRFHHTPLEATEVKDHVAVVAVADRLIRARGTQLEENEHLWDGMEPVLDYLGVNVETREAMLDDYLVKRANAIRDAFTL